MDSGAENSKEVASAKEGISEATTSTTGQSVAYFIIGIFIAVCIVSLVVIFMERSKQQEKDSLDQQIADEVTRPLNDLKKERKQIETVIAQLGVLTVSISDRFPYTTLMSDLAQHEYKQSMWTNLNYNTDGVEITGEANSYEDIAKAVTGLKATKSVKQADLTSVSLNSETNKVTFTVKLTIDNTLYQKAAATQTGGQTQSSSGNVPAVAF